jgi:mono/diheme cytochrome c family protein
MKRLLFALIGGAVALALAGCPKTDVAPTQDAGATVSADEGGSQVPPGAIDPKELVVKDCMSCHTDEMLMQQRLTETQWAAVVKKMVTWGAPIDPGDDTKLVPYLARMYGPDAGPYAPTMMSATEASALTDPLPDGPYAAGDATKGKPIFEEKCGTCHATNAKGVIGVNLVDRPILYRAPDRASTVRKGRGRMLPVQIKDEELASVLAYLRTLH